MPPVGMKEDGLLVAGALALASASIFAFLAGREATATALALVDDGASAGFLAVGSGNVSASTTRDGQPETGRCSRSSQRVSSGRAISVEQLEKERAQDRLRWHSVRQMARREI